MESQYDNTWKEWRGRAESHGNLDSRNWRIKSPFKPRFIMIQKLSVVSVLTLVMLAAVGSVVVATHAFSGSAASPSNGGPVLLSPADGSASGGASQPLAQMTSTTTVTLTNATSASTSSSTAQSSSSSPAGSLLVSGTPSPGSNSTSHYDDGGVGDDSGDD